MTEPAITPELVEQHGLSTDEFDRIKEILGREPTYTELGVFSVMWSEHCSYKNSILSLKTLPREGDCLLAKAGEENAGVVDWGDGGSAAPNIYGGTPKEKARNEKKAKECKAVYQEILKEIMEKDSLIDNITKNLTVYSAMKYITNDLIDLYETKKWADKLKRKYKGAVICIISTGESHYRKQPKDTPTLVPQMVAYTLKESFADLPKEKQLELLAGKVKKDYPKEKKIREVKIIPPNSKRAWSLSVKDYCQLEKDGKKLEELINR